jgi:hypothetical protein
MDKAYQKQIQYAWKALTLQDLQVEETGRLLAEQTPMALQQIKYNAIIVIIVKV